MIALFQASQTRWTAAPAATELHQSVHPLPWTFARGLLYSVSILTAVGKSGYLFLNYCPLEFC